MTPLEVLDIWTDETIANIKRKYNAMGLRASGNFERKLRAEIKNTTTGYNAKIIGAYYTWYLVNGRRHSKGRKSGKSLREIIYDWIVIKGITPKEDDMTQESLSYVIANKIHKRGIEVPNEHNDGTLLDNISTKDMIKNLTLSETVIIKSEILKLFKSVK